MQVQSKFRHLGVQMNDQHQQLTNKDAKMANRASNVHSQLLKGKQKAAVSMETHGG